MKNLLTFSYLLFAIGHSLFAQTDSVRYSQETGTLQKQRFIDQYDYVFMTKEPAKLMVKLVKNDAVNFSDQFMGFNTAYVVGQGPIELGVETKLSPSFSLGVGAYMHPSRITSIFMDNVHISRVGQRPLMLAGETRWYYNLPKRIRAGKSVNNFSGTYLGLRYEHTAANNHEKLSEIGGIASFNALYYQTEYEYKTIRDRISLNWGIQQRFLNHGVFEFVLSLSNNRYDDYIHKYTFKNNDNSIANNPDPFENIVKRDITKQPVENRIVLNSNFRIGIAFGDFKRKKMPPLCDVLRCYENTQRLWKAPLPQLEIGSFSQTANLGFGIEQKLFNSPFSVNMMLKYGVRNVSSLNNNFQLASIILSPRFYVLQAFQQRRLKKGNHLSGVYASALLRGDMTISSYNNNTANPIYFNQKVLRGGLALGWQQKLFKNAYIDATISREKPLIYNNLFYYKHVTYVFSLELGFAF